MATQRAREQAGDGAAGAAPSARKGGRARTWKAVLPETLTPDEQRERVRNAALRLLTVRERSRTELRTRLRQKGFEPDVIEAVLDRLTEAGLQDDRRFATQFAESATGARGMATRRVQAELRRRGVDAETAAAAAAESPESEEGRARALATRKAASLAGLPPEARARRVLGMLARRGYPVELRERIAREMTGDD